MSKKFEGFLLLWVMGVLLFHHQIIGGVKRHYFVTCPQVFNKFTADFFNIFSRRKKEFRLGEGNIRGSLIRNFLLIVKRESTPLTYDSLQKIRSFTCPQVCNKFKAEFSAIFSRGKKVFCLPGKGSKSPYR